MTGDKPSYLKQTGVVDAESLKPKTVREEEPAPDAETVSISDMNGDYSRMRPANKEIPRLHVIYKSGKVETYIYSFLDVKHRYDGDSFTIIFAGTKHWELKVTGRKLWRLYDYITLRRWPYIREVNRDMEQDGEVITEIKATDVTPKNDE